MSVNNDENSLNENNSLDFEIINILPIFVKFRKFKIK